jgi:hypothetical protein
MASINYFLNIRWIIKASLYRNLKHTQYPKIPLKLQLRKIDKITNDVTLFFMLPLYFIEVQFIC